MKKIIGAVLLLGIFLFAFAPTAVMVQALKPTEVGGTYTAIPPPTSNVITNDGKSDNTNQDLMIRVRWDGDISGTGALRINWTNLNVGDFDERGIGNGVVTLTSGISVFGIPKTGTLTIGLHNVVTLGDKSGGVWRILDGTGGLQGLHGEGSLELVSYLPKVVVSYTGEAHFKP